MRYVDQRQTDLNGQPDREGGEYECQEVNLWTHFSNAFERMRFARQLVFIFTSMTDMSNAADKNPADNAPSRNGPPRNPPENPVFPHSPRPRPPGTKRA